MPFPDSASHAVMLLRPGAAALLAVTLILAGIALAARPAGRTSRTATRVLCAIPVASAALAIVTIASGNPDLLTLILLLSCAAVLLALTRVQARRLQPAHEGSTRQSAPRPPDLAAAAPHGARIIPASSGRGQAGCPVRATVGSQLDRPSACGSTRAPVTCSQRQNNPQDQDTGRIPAAAGVDLPRPGPEATSAICQASPTRCQARTRLYLDGRLELEGFTVAGISDHLADASVTIWLDLHDPTTTTSPC